MIRNIRLLAIGLWRFHRKALVIGLSGLLALAGALVAIGGGCPSQRPACGGAASLDGEMPGRALLDRAWFSELPEDELASFDAWVFLSSGVGIHHAGSSYRFTMDTFEFERQGERVELTYLQDGATASTDFTVSRCSELPPFDLCLDLADAPRGPSRYYGFSDDEGYEEHAPAAAALLVRGQGAAATALDR